VIIDAVSIINAIRKRCLDVVLNFSLRTGNNNKHEVETEIKMKMNFVSRKVRTLILLKKTSDRMYSML
jgi:hypothetical protein